MCVEDERGTKNTTDKNPQRPKGLPRSLARGRGRVLWEPLQRPDGQQPGFMSDCLSYTHQYCTTLSVGPVPCGTKVLCTVHFWVWGSCAYC